MEITPPVVFAALSGLASLLGSAVVVLLRRTVADLERRLLLVEQKQEAINDIKLAIESIRGDLRLLTQRISDMKAGEK